MREAITSRHNPLLAHFKRLLTVRAYRAEHREFAADGVKLLAEAVRWGCPLTAVLVQEGVELPEVPAGVRVAEVNAKTMESKKIQGLYFAGEVLDVDAYTGGFNLQIAWATGRAAGIAAAETEGEKEL